MDAAERHRQRLLSSEPVRVHQVRDRLVSSGMLDVSFQTRVRRVGLTIPAAHLPLLAQNLDEAGAREDVWRGAAQEQLGHPSGLVGLRSLVAAGALNHSIVVFATKYPLATQAYASELEPYVVLDWDWIQDPSNGGKGFGFLAHIVAHEVGHTFDAPDEYAGCTALRPDGSGRGALNFPTSTPSTSTRRQ